MSRSGLPGIPVVVGWQTLPLHLLYDHYLSCAGVACTVSVALSGYLYVSSFWGTCTAQKKEEQAGQVGGSASDADATDRSSRVLALGGNTGNPVYDFFIGRELNPRLYLGPLGTLDLKCFCELRPGMCSVKVSAPASVPDEGLGGSTLTLHLHPFPRPVHSNT